MLVLLKAVFKSRYPITVLHSRINLVPRHLNDINSPSVAEDSKHSASIRKADFVNLFEITVNLFD